MVDTVFVNGTFDLLHKGHLELLNFAKSYGNYLIVAIDTDDRVKEKKGPNRPVNTLQDRIDFMKSIKYVDSVVSFNSNKELEQRIQEWDADIMVIGDDYEYHEIIGNHLVDTISFFDKIKNKSTTKILNHENNSDRGIV